MTHKIKARLELMNLYEATKNAGFLPLLRYFQIDFEEVKPLLMNQKNGFDCKVTGIFYTGKN